VHQLVSVPHTATAHLAATVTNALHTTVVSAQSVLPTVTAPNVLVTSVLNVPHTETALLAEIVLLTVTVTNVLRITAVSVLSVQPSTVAETAPHMVTAPSVHALTAMHLVVNAPLMATAHRVEIVLLTVTAMNVPRTTVASVLSAPLSTVENAQSVLPTVTVTNVLRITAVNVLSVQLLVIVLLAETVHPMATAMIAPHVTSAETVPVTTRTKLHVVLLLTSTLQRTRRPASLLKKTSYSSVSKLRQPLPLTSMA
jgi:hypothetical protein